MDHRSPTRSRGSWIPATGQARSGIPNRLFEHIALSGASIAIAMAIAIPAGIWIGHTGRFASFAVNLANLGRALPSLAVIGLVLPLTVVIDPQAGFKVYPTLIAMVVLAIPPILVNTQAGIAGVDRDLVEASRAMGMTERQVVRRTSCRLPSRRSSPACGRPGSRSWRPRRSARSSAVAAWAAISSRAWRSRTTG